MSFITQISRDVAPLSKDDFDCGWSATSFLVGLTMNAPDAKSLSKTTGGFRGRADQRKVDEGAAHEEGRA